MRLTLTLQGAAEAQALLAATAARLSQPPAPLLLDLAAALQRNLQTHIQSQTGPDGPWPPLAPVTRKIRAYYGYAPDGPALVRAGDLLQSLTTLNLEDRAVEVGTRAPYARTLQDGGTLTGPRTGHTRTVQAFPFAYVTAQEIEDLLSLLTAYYFGDPNA
jgi:phage gpG-like protein